MTGPERAVLHALRLDDGLASAPTNAGTTERPKMKLEPLHDRVIVKRLNSETQLPSGIFIPDNVAEKPDQGEVLAVGPGKRNDKGDLVTPYIKPGDRILFGKYSGQTVKVDGDELLVMREEDIFARVAG